LLLLGLWIWWVVRMECGGGRSAFYRTSRRRVGSRSRLYRGRRAARDIRPGIRTHHKRSPTISHRPSIAWVVDLVGCADGMWRRAKRFLSDESTACRISGKVKEGLKMNTQGYASVSDVVCSFAVLTICHILTMPGDLNIATLSLATSPLIFVVFRVIHLRDLVRGVGKG
jgi:hypothetical protein